MEQVFGSRDHQKPRESKKNAHRKKKNLLSVSFVDTVTHQK